MAQGPSLFHCPACGGPVESTAASCPHCGYRPDGSRPVSQTPTDANPGASDAGSGDEIVEPRFCTRCGRPALPEDAFCGRCGGALSSADTPAPRPPVAPTATTQGAPLAWADAFPAFPPPAAATVVTQGVAPQTSTPTWAKLLAATVVIVVVAGVCGLGYYVASGKASATPTPTPTPLTHTVTGSFVLTDTSVYSSGITAVGGQCQGADGYSDIGPGTPVTLKDENGTTLADTSLGYGTGTVARCTFTFTLTGVTDTAKFYSIEVGRRGAITNSHDELKAAGWTFSLSMGS